MIENLSTWKEDPEQIAQYLKDPGRQHPYPIDRYLNGQCDMFAMAVSSLTGLTICIYTEERRDKKTVIEGLVHAFCVDNKNIGRVFDAKGWRSITDIDMEYGVSERISHRIVSIEECYGVVYPFAKGFDKEHPILRRSIDFVKRYYSDQLNLHA